MDVTRPDPPQSVRGYQLREVRILRDATAAYLAVIHDVLPAVNAIGPTGAELAMTLEQAQAPAVSGTPARIAAQVAEFLGEA